MGGRDRGGTVYIWEVFLLSACLSSLYYPKQDGLSFLRALATTHTKHFRHLHHSGVPQSTMRFSELIVLGLVAFSASVSALPAPVEKEQSPQEGSGKLGKDFYILDGKKVYAADLPPEANKELIDFFVHGITPKPTHKKRASTPPTPPEPAEPADPAEPPKSDLKPDWIDIVTSNKAMCW